MRRSMRGSFLQRRGKTEYSIMENVAVVYIAPIFFIRCGNYQKYSVATKILVQDVDGDDISCKKRTN